VGLGILLDTFLVRTVVVPAVFATIGPKVWWPSPLSRETEVPGAPQRAPEHENALRG
jgi:RND superfamily putative drug exporter